MAQSLELLGAYPIELSAEAGMATSASFIIVGPEGNVGPLITFPGA